MNAPRLLRARSRTASAVPRRRNRALLWATLLALVVGVLGLGRPVDDYLRMTRAAFRPIAPSGDIVMVGIDDRTQQELGAWPLPRERYATMVDRLKAAGARHIYFDIIFYAPGRIAGEDRRFAQSLREAGNVSLPVSRIPDPLTGEFRARLPRADFLRYVSLVAITVRYSSLGFVRELPFGDIYGSRFIHSISAAMAEAVSAERGNFPVNYAIDAQQIPAFSASDIYHGNFDPGAIAGKQVMVAPMSTDIGDLYFVPGRGLITGGIINILGAETLKRGTPTDLGWLIAAVVAFGVALIQKKIAGRWRALLLGVAFVFCLMIVPTFFQRKNLFVDVVPALVLCVYVTTAHFLSCLRSRDRALGNFDVDSGLPNLNALRLQPDADMAVLVVAHVRNYDEISASLTRDHAATLVEQIAGRLALGARGAELYKGDGGVFVWGGAVEGAGPDQLDALHALFRSPALIDGRPIDLSVTFGVDDEVEREVMSRVSAALVAADEAAAEGLRWKAHDPARLADADWKLSLLGRLDAAIDDGEVWVAFQPQIALADGRICGAEALVRWSHPQKGLISPAEFVLAAEQHDRIDKLTAFVLGEAISSAAVLELDGVGIDISVNISARLLEKPGLLGTVRRLLETSALPPERLTLEVTESAAMSSGRASIRTLEELGSLGINISIDDYGTGFSTLEYFKRIPATEVKIDRGFVAAIDRNASDRLMVKSTIELSHSLGRTVVAEGVETQEILAELTSLGCDKVQGYLTGRPMPFDALRNLLDDCPNMRAA